MSSWASRPDLTAAQQFNFLRRSHLCRGSGHLGPNSLTWTFKVRPRPLCREYTVEISFTEGDIPLVLVREPDLELLAAGRDLPHVYHHPTRLCLYLPGSGEWVGSMRIDRTFVLWAATWLFYFEEWLWSDDWKGGGEHPSESSTEMGNRSARRSIGMHRLRNRPEASERCASHVPRNARERLKRR